MFFLFSNFGIKIRVDRQEACRCESPRFQEADVMNERADRARLPKLGREQPQRQPTAR
jgi:hypothetical protein